MKTMNHSEYMKACKSKSDNSLRYIIKDANEAMLAMPENENNSYYADEVHYAAMELKARREARNWNTFKKA